MLNEGGVDIVFTAHQHSYVRRITHACVPWVVALMCPLLCVCQERTFPLYNGYYQKQDNHTYINPNSTVVRGAAPREWPVRVRQCPTQAQPCHVTVLSLRCYRWWCRDCDAEHCVGSRWLPGRPGLLQQDHH